MPEPLCWHPSPFKEPEQALLCEALPASLARVLERFPQRIAIRFDGTCCTFSDFARRVAGLADEITQSSAPPGPVALLQSIGPDAVAAWFACAVAGRPLLLLEPTHPAARLKELIEAAAATLIIGDKSTLPSLPKDLETKRLLPSGKLLPWRPGARLDADDPAMIFPTSGSTGTPKLVTYASRTLQVKVQSSRLLMKVPDRASVLIAGSHGNYGFLHHALVFMLSGGTLCLIDVQKEGVKGIVRAIDSDGARHVRFTPSLFRTIAQQPETHDALGRLEGVRFSGEPLLTADLVLAQVLLSPDCLIQNIYGSTESALFVWSNGDDMDASAATVPIGRIYPHSSYALRPVDEKEAQTEVGELVLKSAFHALGDLGSAGIDSARFPLAEGSTSERVYETGDIVRRRPDGSLTMLGRRSRMIKVRGQRVFLTEVENHLRAMPGIAGAATVARDEGADTVIYGFITREAEVQQPANMRDWLADRLPSFMLPRSILVVDEIPMLPGGKVDYNALIQRVPATPSGTAVQTRHDGDHARLATLWQSILGWGAENPEADFFALGGDSLKLMQLTLAVDRAFGKSLPIEAFLANPTLAGLAGSLGVTTAETGTPVKGGLTLRPFRSALGASRGVAMAMPGWRGSALLAPFCQSGFFPDYEIWRADVFLKNGNMVEKQRWWQAAQDIAREIRSSESHAPRILFGYSIGGSIAWIVGRLLAGTPQAPEFVVMIDAAPVHRLLGGSNPNIRDLTSAATSDTAPAVLHVERTRIDYLGIGTQSWLPDENIVNTLEVPTVDHLEMGRAGILSLAVPWLDDALRRHSNVATATARLGQVETLGGRVHRLLTSDANVDPAELDGLSRSFNEGVGAGSMQALIHLMLRDGTLEQASDFIDQLLKRQPGSRMLRYARRRLARSPVTLGTRPRPYKALLSIRSIDVALLLRRDVAPTDGIPNRARQIIDIIVAVAEAVPARLGIWARKMRHFGFRSNQSTNPR